LDAFPNLLEVLVATGASPTEAVATLLLASGHGTPPPAEAGLPHSRVLTSFALLNPRAAEAMVHHLVAQGRPMGFGAIAAAIDLAGGLVDQTGLPERIRQAGWSGNRTQDSIATQALTGSPPSITPLLDQLSTARPTASWTESRRLDDLACLWRAAREPKRQAILKGLRAKGIDPVWLAVAAVSTLASRLRAVGPQAQGPTALTQAEEAALGAWFGNLCAAMGGATTAIRSIVWPAAFFGEGYPLLEGDPAGLAPGSIIRCNAHLRLTGPGFGGPMAAAIVGGSLALEGCPDFSGLPPILAVRGGLAVRDCPRWDGRIPMGATVGNLHTDRHPRGLPLDAWRRLHPRGERA
jgi:hypothetical protein